MTLPAAYVREAVELGYATTIHTAQGVTADTTHGLVDELMTREQLYTTVSRGRTANHLYIAVGDVEPAPHPAYRPSGADRHRHPAASPEPDQPAGLRHHRPSAATTGSDQRSLPIAGLGTGTDTYQPQSGGTRDLAA